MAVHDEDVSKKAYEAIVGIFERHMDEVLELEVLPSAITLPADTLILQDGLCIGFPKKVLVLAFLRARKLFFECRSDESSEREVLSATKVMLLFDPEHITAANYRKNYLLELRNKTNDDFCHAVKQEFFFLDSILTSPLHRQTKSPTLWSHRRWLISTFFPFVCKVRGSSTADTHGLEDAEFWSIFKAGERHPNNYYAWRYARDLVSIVDRENESGHKINRGMEIRDLTDAIVNWCLRHPSDISGWSFLLFLLRRPENDRSNCQRVLERVIDFTLKLRLDHESLWVSIRTILAADSFLPKAIRTEVVQRLQHCVGDEGLASAFTEKVRTALIHIDRQISI